MRSAFKIVLGEANSSTPNNAAVNAIIRKITSFIGLDAYVYPRNADAINIPIPKGMRFFRRAVSVIKSRFAFFSASKIADGANIKSKPKIADIIPML